MGRPDKEGSAEGGGRPAISAARKMAVSLTFAFLLGSLFVANLLYQPPEVSTSERRRLATFPELFVEAAGSSSQLGRTRAAIPNVISSRNLFTGSFSESADFSEQISLDSTVTDPDLFMDAYVQFLIRYARSPMTGRANPLGLSSGNGGAAKVLNPKFAGQFDEYALDSFIFRDGFRRIKAHILWEVFRQKDNNDIYMVGGNAAKIEKLDEGSVRMAGEKIQKILDGLSVTVSAYYSVIPEKGYFIAAQNGYPAVDYGLIEGILSEAVTGAEYIDIKDSLSIGMYYRTDLHWDQSLIWDVAVRLGESMGFADRLGSVGRYS
ncbi:MAG: hypothetical protein FWE70_07405, partial [Oscillospiraceae bacterium]|nr:hypothetical protein [Oscillospiraceae bacterium]